MGSVKRVSNNVVGKDIAEKSIAQITVELCFIHCYSWAPVSFPSLTEPSVLFLLLFVTRDHVSPLDPCWNMDEEMREMRAYTSLLKQILFIPVSFLWSLLSSFPSVSTEKAMMVLFSPLRGKPKMYATHMWHACSQNIIKLINKKKTE